MKNPYRLTDTVYMTAGIKKHLLKHSEEIRKALKRFRSGDYGRCSEKPDNSLIKDFGCYELASGATIWIINYDLFSGREFVTLLLPGEYEREDYEKEDCRSI